MRVKLNGYVVADSDQWIYDWFGIAAFSPGVIRDAITNTTEGEELVLEVNSFGGSVFSGFEMYSVLRAAKCKTVAEVQSLAASAASTVVCACDSVLMSPVAQIMIHLPSTYTEGDREDHMGSVRTLDSIAASILNGYEAKCKGKKTRAELSAMIAAETWLTAHDAVASGLADGILGEEGGEAVPENIVNAVGGGIRSLAAGGALPNPVNLRAEYQRLVDAGLAPARPGALGEPPPEDVTHAPTAGALKEDWRAAARLSVEKIRFGGSYE